VASVDALKSAYQLEIEELNSNTQWNMKLAEVNIANTRVNLEALVSAAALRSKSAEFGATFYQNLVAHTLSSITTLAAEVQQS
jgi:hypothetical protein